MKNIMPAMKTAIILIIMGYAATCTAGDFKLVKQSNNISLYERWITGDNGEIVRELKTVFMAKADIGSIIKLLMDNNKGTDWNSHATIYRVQPAGNHDNRVIYIRYGMPWPFNDQDCCLLYHLNVKNRNRNIITFKSITDKRFPINDETDRITGVQGAWLLEESENKTTKVTYTITTDRSRKIPRWVSDPVIHNNMFSTMSSFKKLAEQTS